VAAQELLLTKGVGKLVVSLHSTDATDAFIGRVRPQLADDLRILDWRTLNDFYQKTVDIYQQQFGFLQAMVMLMVCLSVINTLNMSLLERGWEFGTMRALGNRSKTIVSLIVVESLVLGVVGATLGVVLGVLLALLISGSGFPCRHRRMRRSAMTPLSALCHWCSCSLGSSGFSRPCWLPLPGVPLVAGSHHRCIEKPRLRATCRIRGASGWCA
jgi:hypothetical protein